MVPVPDGYDLGCDVVEVAEITDGIAQFGDRYLRRVFTRAELADCGTRHDRLAARFAAKEAVMKVFGDPSLALPLTDIEVINTGPLPAVRLHGLVAAAATSWDRWQLTLSHTDVHAMAVVLARRVSAGPGSRS